MAVGAVTDMNSSSGFSNITMSNASDSLSHSPSLLSWTTSLAPTKKASCEISKTYKQASQLFLTRRLSEALAVLEPVINPPCPVKGQISDEDDCASVAPVATATTSQRIKIWSLYITLLNAIVDLGIDEGKQSFGQKDYKAILRKVRDGEVWEQVVRNGYGGKEGSVDAEVIYNL